MSAPTTPRHSRHSTMDFQSMSPDERRPASPTHHLHPSFGQGDGIDEFSSSGMSNNGLGELGGDGDGGMGGLGNLADELADALTDDEDEEGEYYDDEDTEGQLQQAAGSNGPRPPGISLSEADNDADSVTGANDTDLDGQRDGSGDAASATSSHGANGGADSLTAANGRRGHKRLDSAYDGSEYGSESDLESSGMPTSLVAKIDAVESLARRGTEENGSPSDGVCKRLTEELRDLGSQSGVEGGASRLITAHSALTTHLTHQTRQLHALAFPLFSPMSLAPPPLVGVAIGYSTDDEDEEEKEDEDDLLPMLSSLADQMPRPSAAAYQSLTALHGLTNDLVSTLNYLSDTLHMARQTTTTATRRLRSAKELVAEMRRDEELREEGERWLARGNWNERLQRRECAHVCGDVVGGFEEVCNGWRARLLAQAEATQASAA